ncbi:unnamed protein product [Coregonus sp. 'balchen']|nr:unnamed protein product [Coregonus sp. 'balchen']
MKSTLNAPVSTCNLERARGLAMSVKLASRATSCRSSFRGTYTVTTLSSLGCLLLVKLEKEQYLLLPENEWFCSKVVVTMPEGDVILFPCYRWVSRGEVVELRGGKASKIFEDELPLLVDHRKKELERNKKLFQWIVYAEGVPHINNATEVSALPSEVKFSFSKMSEFIYTKAAAIAELKLKGLVDSTEQWKDLDLMKHVFWSNRTPISEYVSEHWREDDFFGSQFLNGTNPNVIQRCTTLPPNFPVTDEMEGNIFLCDYKRLKGVPTRVVNGKPLSLTAALCLFYKNPEDKLLPIAIQLEQQPSEQNPIFLPSDSEHDWLLAKIFVRNADFSEYQISYHLLGTHLLAEAFAMATLRSLPIMHPLHKLLIPHFRYTLQINLLARKRLISPDGPLANGAMGLEGLKELLKRAHSEITYSSLCLPENIVARGLESIPNFYYREDGLKLWNIIHSFVQGMVEHFYSSDSEVSRDSELQDWINEIFIHGFLGNNKLGIPKRFDKVEEVVKFVTMIIFTVSAQHCALNMGQFDYGGWVPNNPLLLRKAPPTTKGSSSMNTILEVLPDISTTVNNMASTWLLSKRYADITGTYTVTTLSPLGRLLLVKLEKEQYLFLPENKCQQKIFEDELPLLVDYRKKELEPHKKLFQWNEFAEGLPHMNSAKELSALLAEVLFSFSKEVETIYTRESGMLELKLKGLADSTKQWEDLDKMKKVFWFRKTPISEYVSEYWKEDYFFGSQFLNGNNPNVIQRCTTLPPNFPVTDEMVQPFLKDGRLEGVPTRVVNGEALPLTAALCLFYNNPEDKLMPIAIQLEQQPSEQNPIFLPSDSEHDWLLAKMFVRNADFTEHQNSYHLLGTHLLAEAFAMATLRSLPIMHPLHKDTTLGLEGLKELLKRAHSEITYSSVCLLENIVARGLESIPNFYYREDGLKLWNAINSFVQGMVEHFYSSDSEVSRDSELQDWINEIFIHGFLGNGKSGIPQRFDTVKEVIKFITMVIFTVSAQHSAIPLGSYPNEYIDAADRYFDVTKQMMKHFQAELSYLSGSIIERNSTFTLP